MSEPCWYKRFSLDEKERCQKPGDYGLPDGTTQSSVLSAMRWCLEHSHPGDRYLGLSEGQASELRRVGEEMAAEDRKLHR